MSSLDITDVYPSFFLVFIIALGRFLSLSRPLPSRSAHVNRNEYVQAPEEQSSP